MWACWSRLITMSWIRPKISSPPLSLGISAEYFMHVCVPMHEHIYGSMIISVIGFLIDALCKRMCMWGRGCAYVGLCGSRSKDILNISGVMEWRALFTETEADKSPSHEFGLCSGREWWRSRMSESALSYPVFRRVWESSGRSDLGGGGSPLASASRPTHFN